MSIVTLITDFGTADGYVGEMKGEILTRTPSSLVVDVTHDIAPGDISAASWTLSRIVQRFPRGTVHVCVVDPGVGGRRVPIAARLEDWWYVGPDNGLLSRAAKRVGVAEAWILEPAKMGLHSPSGTFHGRDIFAPAAALLAGGAEATSLGTRTEPGRLVSVDVSEPVRTGERVRGEVVHIDRFGNIVTDVPAVWLTPSALVEIAGWEISGIRATYSSVQSGEMVALVGSGMTLEVAVRDGSAAEQLGITRGETVRVRPERN
ncbi:MAG: SAM-dependent chlorinase/fluorinase [Gemmatimonadota bacterium]